MKYIFTLVHKLTDERTEYGALKIPILSMDGHCNPENSEYDVVSLGGEQAAPFSVKKR
jgi:hypothetical protein